MGKIFGTYHALQNVDLDIQSGEFICLLGGSGRSKTSLLRIIAGLDGQTTGTLLLDAADLSGIDCHKRNIGTVFQSRALFPHLNVGENIV